MGLLDRIGLQVPVFERGIGGVPSLGSIYAQLAGVITSYQHAIAATIGFESMSCSFTAPLDVAQDWLGRLMYQTIVTGPDAEVVWEGFLETVEVQFGQEKISLSLDGMTNRVRVRYTTVLGTPGATATASDAASIALYGTRDGVVSVGQTIAARAASLRDSVLAARKNPVASPTSEVKTGALGDVQVSLSFAGWYTALGWLLTSNTSTTDTTTTTQVQTLITAYVATNAFLSTDYSLITSSGIPDTELIVPDTSYRDKIEAMLKKGNSNNNRLAWGIYEGRRFQVNEWAGAAPTTPRFYRSLPDYRVFDALNNTYVAPWDVRPDGMYRLVNTIDVLAPGTADASATRYIERVTFSASGDSIGVNLEPQAYSGIDARLARIG